MNVDALDRPLRIAAVNAHEASLENMRSTVDALGYEFQGFERSQEFRQALQRQAFDLLLLEWHLPDLGGAELIHWLRDEMGNQMPAMVIARRATKKDLIAGLYAGADVFLAAPEAHEVSARLEALIRRAFPLRNAATKTFGPYRFLPEARVLQLHDEIIDLQFREYDLARFMFQNLGRLLTRKRICDAVWGMSLDPRSRALDTRMSRIRTRLHICPANGFVLSASYGQGYRLDAVDAGMLSSAVPD
ncbi:MAG: response regulator transcription factor [Pseudomonadota bacterium]